MSRSKTLYQLQQYDTDLDMSYRRIEEIDTIVSDTKDLEKLRNVQEKHKQVFENKQESLRLAELQVEEQISKIKQSEDKLYSGVITNPKELEDLQLESQSLKKYLAVLEERQLEKMLDSEQAFVDYDEITVQVEALTQKKDSNNKILLKEKDNLLDQIKALNDKRTQYLNVNAIPDLSEYTKLRESLGGIAVTLVVNSSCSSCGANIPSAIEQEARSPGNLISCPTCRRFLHPDNI